MRDLGLRKVSNHTHYPKLIGDVLDLKQLVNTDKIGLILTIAPESPKVPSQAEVRFRYLEHIPD